jgi:hypothetical protein
MAKAKSKAATVKQISETPLTPGQKLDLVGQEVILTQIGEGMFYSAIAGQAGVSRGALIRWLEAKCSDLYARAREMRADTLAEQILEIADHKQDDTYIDGDGNVRTDADVVARARLRVDSRKWLASKMLPKIYGDKQDLNVTGTVDIATAILEARKRTS